MHDIEHTGRNNLFEINSISKLAVRYNDNSVLENHHAARAFQILKIDELNIFEKMHPEEFPLFRKFVVHGILSTDIKNHFNELAAMKQRIDSGDFNPQEESNTEEMQDFLLFIGVLMHACDLYVPTL